LGGDNKPKAGGILSKGGGKVCWGEKDPARQAVPDLRRSLRGKWGY